MSEEHQLAITTDGEKQLMLKELRKALNIVKDLPNIYIEAMKLDRGKAIDALERLYYEAMVLPVYPKDQPEEVDK